MQAHAQLQLAFDSDNLNIFHEKNNSTTVHVHNLYQKKSDYLLVSEGRV